MRIRAVGKWGDWWEWWRREMEMEMVEVVDRYIDEIG